MDTHRNVVGGLYTAVGLSGLVGAWFVFVSMVGGGLVTGEPALMLFVPALGVVISIFILAFSLPTLIVGVGLFLDKAWARRFFPVVGAVNLLNVPFGTLVGAYALWVNARESV